MTEWAHRPGNVRLDYSERRERGAGKVRDAMKSSLHGRRMWSYVCDMDLRVPGTVRAAKYLCGHTLAGGGAGGRKARQA